MYGHVVDADGIPLSGIGIEYGEDGISTMNTSTDVDGEFKLALVVNNRANAERSHVWYIRLTENGQPASETFKWQSDTIKDCEKNNSVQVKEIKFRRRY
jgi:hypothetical protein